MGWAWAGFGGLGLDRPGQVVAIYLFIAVMVTGSRAIISEKKRPMCLMLPLLKMVTEK